MTDEGGTVVIIFNNFLYLAYMSWDVLYFSFYNPSSLSEAWNECLKITIYSSLNLVEETNFFFRKDQITNEAGSESDHYLKNTDPYWEL